VEIDYLHNFAYFQWMSVTMCQRSRNPPGAFPLLPTCGSERTRTLTTPKRGTKETKENSNRYIIYSNNKLCQIELSFSMGANGCLEKYTWAL